ncbi:MAG: type I glyceraldehyde-3-phosphate dehydrogenase [Candidatus Dependentiae bacterium]
MRIAINGFGRIGRNFLRTIFADPEAQKKLNVVAINIGPASLENVAHMFKYDTLMGTFKGKVDFQDSTLSINDHKIVIVAESDPAKLDWSKFDIDWVVEASGRYTGAKFINVHQNAGAKYTLITAPCKGEVTTIVPGVNCDSFDKKKDHIVSLASCTTNAIMPMLKVLHDKFQIEQGFMTTIHAYTNTQVLLDVESDDLRRARAAALNIIPTSTGASRMIDQIMPSIKGRIQAMAIRVPVAKVSLIDLVIKTKKTVDEKKVNQAFFDASQHDLKGILSTCNEPLVSSDYSGCDYSVVIDTPLTQAEGNLCKTFGWYDNEWGYSMRLKDFLMKVS